jgi:(p)ppGpp synthase/HD superfamily hydrolase
MTLDVHTKKIIEAIATVAHVGQYDLGDKDQPHIKHVRMVASNFEGVRPANAFWLEEDQDELWGLSMLHDVYEDSGVTPGTLTRLGVPQRIAMGVDLLSRRIITEAGEKEHYDEYIERLIASWDYHPSADLAIPVKIYDLTHNMNRSQFQAPSLYRRYVKAMGMIAERTSEEIAQYLLDHPPVIA